MVKKVLLLVLLLVGFFAQAQIVNIPDVNFKALLLASNPSSFTASDLTGNHFAIDANSDGEIQISEALAVGSLFINPETSIDCTGLASFINLSNIQFSGNSTFTNIDVSQMQGLNAFVSDSGGSIENLNFSANHSLETIMLWGTDIDSLILP